MRAEVSRVGGTSLSVSFSHGIWFGFGVFFRWIIVGIIKQKCPSKCKLQSEYE